MDERVLSELFRSVPGDPPPASFDEADVATASRRITVRRRAAAGGVAAGVVLLVGGGLATGAVLGGSDGDSGGSQNVAESRPSADRGIEARGEQPAETRERQPQAHELPDAEPKQGGEDGRDRTHGCEEVDRELATALAGELPVGADEASPGRFCPEGTSSVSFRVEGSALTAVLAPPDVDVRAPAGSADADTAERTTSSGSTLLLVSEPLTRAALDGPDVGRLVDRLAPSL